MRRQSSSMVVTQAIIALNVVVFAAVLLPGGQEIGALGVNFGPATIGGEWWRLLTCVFHPRRTAAHRIQYVVLVGSGQTG
jgi:membrane associated rhomboid family serine protease